MRLLLGTGRCSGCDRRGAQVLCTGCEQALLQAPASADGSVPDEGPARLLVRRAKAGRVRSVVPAMARIAARRLTAGTPPVDVVCWVPADPVRARRRGAHLPTLYARALARELGVPAAGLLARRPGRAQRGLGRARRLANVQRLLRPAARAPRLAPGTRVLVVDDVRTTGATLAAAGALLESRHLVVHTHAFAAVPARANPSNIA